MLIKEAWFTEVDNNAYKNIEDVSTTSVTSGDLTSDHWVLTGAHASPVETTTCSSMANCRDIGKNNFRCSLVTAEDEVENRKGIEPGHNSTATIKREATKTQAPGLWKRSTFVIIYSLCI